MWQEIFQSTKRKEKKKNNNNKRHFLFYNVFFFNSPFSYLYSSHSFNFCFFHLKLLLLNISVLLNFDVDQLSPDGIFLSVCWLSMFPDQLHNNASIK
jgi:hypothetical protein